MADVGAKILGLGEGWYDMGPYGGQSGSVPVADWTGDSLSYEGRRQVFLDKGPMFVTGGVRMFQTRSGGDRITRVVRNAGVVNLLPKRLVGWASGYRLNRVDHYCATTADPTVAGVVDEYFPPTGVPVGQLFNLSVKGPTLLKTSTAGDASGTIPLDTVLVAKTANGTTDADAGHPAPQDLSGATALLGAQIQYRIGRALSAMTSGQTSADMLVDLELDRG